MLEKNLDNPEILKRKSNGFSVLTAGYNEYFFDVPSRPSLLIKYQGQEIYNGKLACLSARTTRAEAARCGNNSPAVKPSCYSEALVLP